MKLNDDYEPKVGDLVQYTGTGSENEGQIGVIVGKTRFVTGYRLNRKKSWLYAIHFPCGLWNLKPHHFKIIKKSENNT
jgi:hypothetical protein